MRRKEALCTFAGKKFQSVSLFTEKYCYLATSEGRKFIHRTSYDVLTRWTDRCHSRAVPVVTHSSVYNYQSESIYCRMKAPHGRLWTITGSP